MLTTLFKLLTPSFSFIMVCTASALLTTLIPIRLNIAAIPVNQIGIIAAGFYAGMIIGAFKIEKLVSRIGHIRGYAAFAAILTVVTLCQGLYFEVFTLFMLRLFTGFSMAGIFIIIESWFLVSGPKEHKGKLLAIYMTIMYAAQSGGQFILLVGDIHSLELFCIMAILFSISIIPLTLTKMQSPMLHEPSAVSLRKIYKVSPTGVMSAFSAGIILSSLYSFLPIYASIDNVPIVVGFLILGGMLLQYPMGKISDLFDRRKILIILTASIAVFSVLMILFSLTTYLNLFIIGCAIFGGIVHILYPLSISHVCDYVEQEDIVATTQSLLLSYGIGATLGPVLSSWFMLHRFGLFIFISIVSSILGFFIYKRGFVRRDLPLEQQQSFSLSSNTTPVATNMEIRSNLPKEALQKANNDAEPPE